MTTPFGWADACSYRARLEWAHHLAGRGHSHHAGRQVLFLTHLGRGEECLHIRGHLPALDPRTARQRPAPVDIVDMRDGHAL